jgi:hypothetical protein
MFDFLVISRFPDFYKIDAVADRLMMIAGPRSSCWRTVEVSLVFLDPTLCFSGNRKTGAEAYACSGPSGQCLGPEIWLFGFRNGTRSGLTRIGILLPGRLANFAIHNFTLAQPENQPAAASRVRERGAILPAVERAEN